MIAGLRSASAESMPSCAGWPARPSGTPDNDQSGFVTTSLTGYERQETTFESYCLLKLSTIG
jgi:hypothetical protein